MNKEDKELANEIMDGSKAIVIGDNVTYAPLSVGGRSFHFDAYQIRFLYALQKYQGNLETACNFVGRSMEWANKFITSRKFKEFRNCKLASMSALNGDLVEWWWQFGMDGARGYKESYEAVCSICSECNLYTVVEAEMMRTDSMDFKGQCKTCLQPVELLYHREEFKPSREQVQFWSELGNRKVPKIERVQHEFSSERFEFISEEA